jgi:hypothetical protein
MQGQVLLGVLIGIDDFVCVSVKEAGGLDPLKKIFEGRE